MSFKISAFISLRHLSFFFFLLKPPEIEFTTEKTNFEINVVGFDEKKRINLSMKKENWHFN